MLFKVVLNKQIRIFDPNDQPKFEDLISYIKVTFRQLPFKYQLFYLDEQNDEITLKNDTDFKIMKKTAKKTAKVFIKEAIQESQDSTQNIVLDFEEESQEFGQVRQQIENIDLEEKPQRIEEVSEIQLISQNSFMNESLISIATSHINQHVIEKKMREMMPEFFEQLKRSIIKESSESKIQEKPSFDKVPFKIVHNNILCDECQFNNIEGVRYKCAVCADFDLCENCESVTTHDHPFLKIKNLSPYSINITALKCYNYQMRIKNILQKCQKNGQNSQQGLKKAKQQSNKVVREADITSNAIYLCEKLQLEFTKCYMFSQKCPGLTKEQLLELYLYNKSLKM